MTILSDFEYIRPASLKDALKILAKEKNSRPFAGGTDLICLLKEDRISCSTMVDLKNIKSLDAITLSKDKKAIHIGALVTFSDLIDSPLINKYFPIIMEMSKAVASNAIRNRATMVGNICSAVPCMDSGSVLVALDASIHLESSKGKRVVSSAKWFVAPRKTTIKKGELVTSISIPLVAKNNYAGSYLKLGRYQGEDLAQVSLCFLVFPKNEYRVAFGAVAPVPVRAHAIEKLLNGKEMTPEILKEASLLLEKIITPITDVRASKEYRMHMAKIMLGRALAIADARLKGEGPEYGTARL